ncbi:hypothetical protein XENTR_v10012641 [Xenopus tropicalis]|nr:hypothetical protein XENTR_v10012641 [Xenopus tropicalis]
MGLQLQKINLNVRGLSFFLYTASLPHGPLGLTSLTQYGPVSITSLTVHESPFNVVHELLVVTSITVQGFSVVADLIDSVWASSCCHCDYTNASGYGMDFQLSLFRL